MCRTVWIAALTGLSAFAFSFANAQETLPSPTSPASPSSLTSPTSPTTSPAQELLSPSDQPLRPNDMPAAPPRFNEGFDSIDTLGAGMGRGGMGFGGFGLGASGPGGPAVLALTDRSSWYPNQRVAGQGTEFGFIKESIGLSVPLYRDGPNTIAFTTGVGATIFTGNAILPETGQPFPSTIWNIHFGTNYTHLFANDWLGTLGVSIGSSSDKPFENWSQVNFGLHAMLRIPSGECNAWLFSLSYSPLGQLGFPVPGVAFQWVVCDWLRMNIGLPFVIVVTPTPDWQFTASYMLLTTIHTQLSYRVAPRVRIFAGYDWTNEGFHLAEQTNAHDRFLYYEMRVNVGTRFNWGQFRFDVSGGYAFDRFFAQGRGAFNTQNRVDIGNGPYLALTGSYRW